MSDDVVRIFEVATADNFDEQRYLSANHDVRQAVNEKKLKSGLQHFQRHGKKEGRKQHRADYLLPLRKLRRQKADRIAAVLKPDCGVVRNGEDVFDFRGGGRMASFGFSETTNVSSNIYDETPLGIIERFPGGLILDCGAGYRPEYYADVVNYEIAPYPTTDVLGFAEDLPFKDESFDAVFSFAVLEHVKYPFRAAQELCRVLKPGGTLAVGAAFMQPVHGYPHHYFNMTHHGMGVLFAEQIEIERQFVNQGTSPIASLSWFLREWLDDLPDAARKRFARMRIGDIAGQPAHRFANEPYVTALEEESNFKLACATRMVGKKPG